MKLTAMELLCAIRTLDVLPERHMAELTARVKKVLALHPRWNSPCPNNDVEVVCRACGMPYPCPTVRYLDGEEP